MDFPGYDPIATISEHSEGFALAAAENLAAPVRHCPDWTVADLVRHLIEVHWFWATIADERLSEPPEEERRPARVGDEQLIEVFRAGAARLVSVLAAADGADAVWTWAPAQHDIDFITRHQVQEAAVHHWDVVDAAGGNLSIGAPAAADAVSEFLTFSISSDADPADPPRPALEARFGLRCSDAGASWTITDGSIPGTLAVSADLADDLPSIAATASDLLLWLYGRVDLDAGAVPPDVIGRFRALCFTD